MKGKEPDALRSHMQMMAQRQQRRVAFIVSHRIVADVSNCLGDRQ